MANYYFVSHRALGLNRGMEPEFDNEDPQNGWAKEMKAQWTAASQNFVYASPAETFTVSVPQTIV
jgi:hypothetical protein